MASSQIGGALPADLPPAADSVGKTDKQIARNTAAKLTTAIKGTKDPQLKAEFAKSLAQLHSYLAQDNKARKQASAKPVRAAKPTKTKKA